MLKYSLNVSFEWLHCRMSSTDSEVRTTYKTDSTAKGSILRKAT